jgi:adenosylhomocysteine nucleosidase
MSRLRRQLGIVAACQSEAALVCRSLRLQYKDTTPAGRLWSGQAYGQNIVLLRSGMGAERATGAATWLVQHYALHGLLSVGFAGGLQAALATGDTLLPQQVQAWCGDITGDRAVQTAPLCTDASLARLATLSARQAHLRQHQGTLLTVPEVLRHATTKQHLGQCSGALAADMESYSIAQVAVAHAIPFMPLRTIFDTCDDDIPLPVGQCISTDGVVRPIGVLCALASHPGAFLHTVPMWWQAHRAGRALVSWLQHFFPLLRQPAPSQEDRQCLL